jgi:hypothetical protein
MAPDTAVPAPVFTGAPRTGHHRRRGTAMSRHVVEVNEVVVFATGRGAGRWATFLLAHRSTDRISEVDVSLGGAICHVACDRKDDAEWLARSMVEQHGLPKSAVKVRPLRDGRAR